LSGYKVPIWEAQSYPGLGKEPITEVRRSVGCKTARTKSPVLPPTAAGLKEELPELDDRPLIGDVFWFVGETLVGVTLVEVIHDTSRHVVSGKLTSKQPLLGTKVEATVLRQLATAGDIPASGLVSPGTGRETLLTTPTTRKPINDFIIISSHSYL
jgi:hypothetical protein